MKIIAIVNNKGGVGKTTVSKLIAEYFSYVKNERTLAIDMDPQANFSNRFLRMEIDPYQQEGKIPPKHPDFDPEDKDEAENDGRSSIAGIFFGDLVYPYPTHFDKLEIIPSHSSKLLLAEAVTREEVVQKVYEQLSRFLSLDDVVNSYDNIIIDTPPSKGPLTISVVRAATDLIIPSIMEPQPIEGIYGMIHLWKSEALRRSEDKPLNLLGVLPNSFVKRGNIHQQLLDDLKCQMPEYVFDSVICRRLIYSEVDADGAAPPTLFDYPNSNPAKREVIQACQEIEERMHSYVN